MLNIIADTNITKLTVTFAMQCIFMNPVVKKYLLRTGIILISVFTLAVAVAAIFEDEIGRKIISEINKNIKTKLEVKDVSFSLIRHFPKASATLKDVKLNDLSNGQLLKIEELSLSMGLWSIISGKPEISSIQLTNGLISLKIDSKGNSNYDILKDNTADSKEENASFTIKKAILSNLTVSYTNAIKQSDYKVRIDQCTLAGEFSADQFLLDIDSESLVQSIKHNNSVYLEQKPIKLKGVFDVNNKTGMYKINECLLEIASNQFAIQGTIKNTSEGTDFDVYALGKEINLATISKLGIEDLEKTTSEYESEGIIRVNARIDGILNATSNPAVLVQYNLKDGVLRGRKIGGAIDKISFSGSFSNGWAHNMQSSSFSLDNCKASFNGLPFSLELKVRNFENPEINVVANGKIPLANIYKFIPDLQGGSGFINLRQFSLLGTRADMQSRQNLSKVKASGALFFENAVVNYRGEDLKFISGNITMSNEFIGLNKLIVKGLDTDLGVEGKISNVIPFVFNNTDTEKLSLDIHINSSGVNLEKWMYVFSGETASGSESADNKMAIDQPFKFIEGTIRADLDEVKHKKIIARNFTGELIFENGDMLVSGDVVAMQGDWNVEGQLSFDKGCQLKATLESSKVSIKEFFSQAENFGQNTLTDDNLSGKLNSRILILANWNEQGVFDKNKLHVYGSLSIDNGELIRFKMMENFSKFIKIKDLRDIRFVNLRNLIEIENGVIHIPAMFIQSNAINMTVSGEHSYNNDVEYNFKINAGQLLLNKFNLLNKTTDALPAKKGGFFNLYYNLKGNINNFSNKKDKVLVKSNFTKSEIRKHKIMNTLLAEFGSMPEFDEPSEWVDEGEKKYAGPAVSSYSVSVPATTGQSLKSTFKEARETLKNPAKASGKTEKTTFKDEADENEEYLDFN